MAAKRTQPGIVAGIILDRFRGLPQKETAHRLGFRCNEAVSRICTEIDLDAIELEIRQLCAPVAGQIPQEVLTLNADYENLFKDITTEIQTELKKLGGGGADVSFRAVIEKIQVLSAAVMALERARDARGKILGLESEAKRLKQQAKPTEAASRFDTYLD
jgi:hypothetical protein